MHLTFHFNINVVFYDDINEISILLFKQSCLYTRCPVNNRPILNANNKEKLFDKKKCVIRCIGIKKSTISFLYSLFKYSNLSQKWLCCNLQTVLRHYCSFHRDEFFDSFCRIDSESTYQLNESIC